MLVNAVMAIAIMPTPIDSNFVFFIMNLFVIKNWLRFSLDYNNQILKRDGSRSQGLCHSNFQLIVSKIKKQKMN